MLETREGLQTHFILEEAQAVSVYVINNLLADGLNGICFERPGLSAF